MRSIFVYLIMAMFLQGAVLGFADTAKVKKSQAKKTVAKTAVAAEKKCPDNCDKKCVEKCKNSKDYFVDKDNDGICDERAKGMGFNSKNRCSENGCMKQMKNKTK